VDAGGEGGTPPDRFLIPVEGLRVPRPWTVGRVVLHPGSTAEDLISDTLPFDTKEDLVRQRVLNILHSAGDSSIAEVRGQPDIDEAIDSVRASLDALRLFQLSRRISETTSFGLPGDLYQAKIEYVAVWEYSAPGWRFRGDSAGWEFTSDACDDWSNSVGFQFLSESLADPSISEAARRAGVGAQLFARAASEHRADLKMLGVASALEAWLLRRQPGAQTLTLARHVSWFGCGIQNNDLCGRDRPICPYLHLDPELGRDRQRLTKLRDLGNAHVAWRCSEWHRVMDWYDARSGAAHGDPTAVDTEHAEQAEYWVAHYLAEPILDWLRTHPDDPIGHLEQELDRVDHPRGWQAMLDALDSRNPSSRPPQPE
jgi:hypothetical protein